MSRSRLALFLAVMFAITACGTNRRAARPPIDPALMNAPKEELFARAEAAFESNRHARARQLYSYIYETFPNDPLGRRALLRVADTYFEQGDAVNLVEAQYKYRDFINRYPGSDNADYAMLQIANVSYKQMERPDRDQAKTREAIQKFREMIAAYPRSEHREEADKKLNEALDRLARHEHIVAQFYMKRRNWDAAIARLNGIVETYPNYSGRDATFFDLGSALSQAGRKGEARLYFERVISEFPESEFARAAKERLEGMSA
jgi:outer membrane protein assembly factor BamD